MSLWRAEYAGETRELRWVIIFGVWLVVLYLAFPRYDWRPLTIGPGRQTLVRIDRWTGKAESGLFTAGAVGDWYPVKP